MSATAHIFGCLMGDNLKPIGLFLIFVVGMFALDRGIAVVLDTQFRKLETGEVSGLVNASVSRGHRDVIFFGSSRAQQHFDTAVIEESVKMTAYNSGADGQGLFYARGVQALMLKRDKKAKFHVVQVDPVDLISPRVHRTKVLLPLVEDAPEIADMLRPYDRWIDVKLWSKLYRYNSAVLPILKNTVRPGTVDDDGFLGKPAGRRGVSDAEEVLGKEGKKFVEPEIDKDAVKVLRDFVEDGKKSGVTVYIVTSPMDLPTRSKRKIAEDKLFVETMERLAREDDFVWLNLMNEPSLTKRELFHDKFHLNVDGARVLTQIIADRILIDAI